MSAIEYIVDNNPSDDDNVIRDGLVAFNNQFIVEDSFHFSVFAKHNNLIVGGALIYEKSDALYIGEFWCHEKFRRQGIGTKIMALINRAAIDKQLSKIFASAYDFQFPEFYRKQGFIAIGTIPKYMLEHNKIFMRKDILNNDNNAKLIANSLLNAVEYIVDNNPRSEDDAIINDGVVAFNNKFITEKLVHFSIFAKHNNLVVGGTSVCESNEALYIDALWCNEDFRKQGLGAKIIDMIYRIAVDKRLSKIFVDTFDFQAPEFYQKQGFHTIGILPKFVLGHDKIFMRKDISDKM